MRIDAATERTLTVCIDAVGCEAAGRWGRRFAVLDKVKAATFLATDRSTSCGRHLGAVAWAGTLSNSWRLRRQWATRFHSAH